VVFLLDVHRDPLMTLLMLRVALLYFVLEVVASLVERSYC
jgi:hypothetical protein